jgi:hypothetical protein
MRRTVEIATANLTALGGGQTPACSPTTVVVWCMRPWWALGALALLASLLVLQAAVPQWWWSEALIWLGWGLMGATAAWVTASTVNAAPNDGLTTRFWAIGFAAGFLVAALAGVARAIRRHR